ncbi:hypothetical protein RF11_15752 [Thelohanellus kitauei]|uniref:Uncharacterized protein n=1 Tax=Thelohanellus kitauei TaxID=669202 RepID=A0A0C2MLN5_THEKT|nr:hypothetical protein RF11_15752 [Thelohanellus kitauei]
MKRQPFSTFKASKGEQAANYRYAIAHGPIVSRWKAPRLLVNNRPIELTLSWPTESEIINQLNLLIKSSYFKTTKDGKVATGIWWMTRPLGHFLASVWNHVPGSCLPRSGEPNRHAPSFPHA